MNYQTNVNLREDNDAVQSQIVKSFTSVTPFSKFLALGLFVVLPFVGFYLGRVSALTTIGKNIESESNYVTPEKTSVPETSQTSTASSSYTSISLPFSREEIFTGAAISFSDEYISNVKKPNSSAREYIVTSVRNLNIPEKQINHTAFQACFRSTWYENFGVSCRIFVLNTQGKLVELMSSPGAGGVFFDKNENIDFLYQQAFQDFITWNILNPSSGLKNGLYFRQEDISQLSHQLNIKTDAYPYVYLKSVCTGSVVGRCWTEGFDIDSEPIVSVRLAKTQFKPLRSPFDDNQNWGLSSQIEEASMLVNNEYITVQLEKTVESSRAETATTTISVHNETSGLQKNLFSVTVPVNTETSLTYDYANVSDVAEIRIGEKVYSFNFLTNKLTEQ